VSLYGDALLRIDWSWAAAALWLAGAATLAAVGVLASWVAVVYATASIAAFAAYAADKSQAEAEGRRLPERVLHVLEAMGGWPGALVAQRQFRHKTRKVRFQIIFWLIVAAHLGVAAACLYFQVGPCQRDG